MTLTKTKLEKVLLTDTKIKLVLPERVLNQVKWLCKEISAVEWSGVLYYSIEGSIKDPENMVITLEYILPMHKGTSGYTEYELGESVVEFMMENEEAEDWKMGHVHSHNTMNVFFSGTDMSELEDNAPNHNFYLSFIVNNFMEFCAKVCFIAESGVAQFTAKDEHGKSYEVGTSDSKQTKLVIYDCDIDSPSTEISVTDDFADKVKGIIKAAIPVTPIPNRTVVYPKNQSNGGATSKVIGTNKTRITPRVGGFMGKSNPGLDAWEDDTWRDAFGGPTTIKEPKTPVEIEEERLEEELMMFTMLVLNTGNDVFEDNCIEDVIVRNYKPFSVTPGMLAGGVLNKYTEVYNSYYREIPEKDDPVYFIEATQGVIDTLIEEQYTSNDNYLRPMLAKVVESLENMLTKYKNYESITGK